MADQTKTGTTRKHKKKKKRCSCSTGKSGKEHEKSGRETKKAGNNRKQWVGITVDVWIMCIDVWGCVSLAEDSPNNIRDAF